MMPSSRRIDALPGVVRQHARAAGRRQDGARSAGVLRSGAGWPRRTAAGLSADQQVLAGLGVDAAGGDGLVTTGTPIAMASRILFCVPRAMLSGATISAERRTYGRTSGTEPVTVTPGNSPELAHRRRRIGADDQQLELRPAAPGAAAASCGRSRTCTPGSGSSPCGRRSRSCRRRRPRRRAEEVGVDAVRKPVGGRRRCRSPPASPIRRAWWPCRGRSGARAAFPRAPSCVPSSR